MLVEEFLKPKGLSPRELAEGIRVPYAHMSELVNGRRRMTPSTARRLAKSFGTTAGFWMNLQLRWDLFQAPGLDATSAGPACPLPEDKPLDRT